MKNDKSNPESAASSATASRSSSANSKITSFFKDTTGSSICVTEYMIRKAFLCMVTVDGRPFSAVEDKSVSLMYGPAMQALKASFNRRNIADLVDEASKFIKAKLKADFANSLISVKVDCATRQFRSFLGMNVQVSVYKYKLSLLLADCIIVFFCL